MRRSAVIGGVGGPVVFVATWATLGARTSGYSPMSDPISRLAAVDAQTRWPMTAAMLALAAGLGLFARGLVPKHAWAAKAAGVTALATVGIAATPLGSRLGGAGHATAAGAAYMSLAAVPALVAIELRRGKRSSSSKAATATTAAAITATALAMSVILPSNTGGWQRLGLTTGHAWIALYAIASRFGDGAKLRSSNSSLV